MRAAAHIHPFDFISNFVDDMSDDKQHNRSTSEKRAFSRQNEKACLSYRVLTRSELQRLLAARNSGTTPRENLDAQSLQAQQIIQSMEEAPNLEIRLLLQEQLQLLAHSTNVDKVIPWDDEVNLSAGGLAFAATTHIAPGSFLEIAIALANPHLRFSVLGVVVRCANSPASNVERPYRVGVDFINLTREDHESLMALTQTRTAHPT